MKFLVALAFPQVTVTGQLPFGVLVATVQDQLTIPAPSEVFGPSPDALLVTPLYTTLIVHLVFGVVTTSARTVPPRLSGEDSDVKATPAAGFDVEVGAGVRVFVAVGEGVLVGVLVGIGL